MGTTLSSIHVYSEGAVRVYGFEFQSFSAGWQTYIGKLGDNVQQASVNEAKLISKRVNRPVLHYYIHDSDYIEFRFFQGGKCTVLYSDDEFVKSKNVYGIPALIGYGEGYKKRLSSILDCSDAEEKTRLLEEFFGVCLMPSEESIYDPYWLNRKRGDGLYTEYIKTQEAISGKGAPVGLKLVVEIKGKIYRSYFGDHTKKEHCYLFGYDAEGSDRLVPVRFAGERLEPIPKEEFGQGRMPFASEKSFYDFDGETMNGIVFNDKAPLPYKGRRIRLPGGSYPFGFDSKNRVVLSQKGRIAIMDEELKIIAKCPIKGEPADMVDDCILTTTGLSFCGYVYDPLSTVRIYKLIEKEENL